MPDFERMGQMADQISLLAVFIGAVGMLNTMLMSVLERTREIGVLRSLGWRRRQVLGMILKESLVLGVVGGICGILLGVGLAGTLAAQIPQTAGAIDPRYSLGLFAQASGAGGHNRCCRRPLPGLASDPHAADRGA